MMMDDMSVPVITPPQPPAETHGCGGNCGAVRHIEDLAHEVDFLRVELRRCERSHSEDIRKLWIKIAAIAAAVAAIVPTGWATFLGMI